VAAQLSASEACGGGRGGQPPDDPWVVDEVLDEGVRAWLQRVGVRGGHAHRVVVAVEDRQRAARAQYPERLSEHVERVRDVAEDSVQHGQVE